MRKILISCVVTFAIFGLASLTVAHFMPSLLANTTQSVAAPKPVQVSDTTPTTPTPDPTSDSIKQEISTLTCGDLYVSLINNVEFEIEQLPGYMDTAALKEDLMNKIENLDCVKTGSVPIPSSAVNTGDGTRADH